MDPDFHDGLLLGIILSPDREELTLLCRRVDGKDFSVVVPQLVKLRADNFFEGNIIYDISIHEGSECPADAVLKIFNYNDDESQKYLGDRVKELVQGKWTLLTLTASYGCELLAMSKAPADKIAVH